MEEKSVNFSLAFSSADSATTGELDSQLELLYLFYLTRTNKHNQNIFLELFY